MNSIGYFDSHTHLQDKRLKGDLSNVIERAEAAGVSRMICCGTRERDWDTVVAITQKYSFIVHTFGVHPWFVNKVSDGWEKKLTDYLNILPSAVGECGLDFVVQEYKREVQEYIFKRQLLIAEKMHLPVSIHHCSLSIKLPSLGTFYKLYQLQ